MTVCFPFRICVISDTCLSWCTKVTYVNFWRKMSYNSCKDWVSKIAWNLNLTVLKTLWLQNLKKQLNVEIHHDLWFRISCCSFLFWHYCTMKNLEEKGNKIHWNRSKNISASGLTKKQLYWTLLFFFLCSWNCSWDILEKAY